MDEIVSKVQEGSGGIGQIDVKVKETTLQGSETKQRQYRIRKKGDMVRMDMDDLGQSIVLKNNEIQVRGRDRKVHKNKTAAGLAGQTMDKIFGKDLAEMKKDYDLQIDRQASQSDKELYVVLAVPKKKNNSTPPLNLTVDMNKGLVIKSEQLTDDHKPWVTTEVLDSVQKNGKWVVLKTRTKTNYKGRERIKETQFEFSSLNEGVSDTDFELGH